MLDKIDKMKSETDNEQLILQAAEEEFLEKGFDGAKTTSIAQKAGVTHAMLHYYYRTKEKLFELVFRNKVKLIANSFKHILDEDKSFEETISDFIRAHFEFIKKNPRLVNFVYNEIYKNKENRDILYRTVFPFIQEVIGKVNTLVETEKQKGTIRSISPLQLILNILSLNIMTFIAYPVMIQYVENSSEELYEQMLKEREESNVEFILNSIKK